MSPPHCGCCLLLCSSMALFAGAGRDAPPRLTPAPAGPYHVSGNRILDAGGHAYLVRGTEMPTVTLDPVEIVGDGKQFGVFSPSSFITIRQRLNMNAVRLPVNAPQYAERADYRARVGEIVRSANRFELLVILAADAIDKLSPDALRHFWAQCAAEFKRNPNVFFAPSFGAQAQVVVEVIDAIRSSGADQPILIAGPEERVQDPNLIYEVTPRYATTRTDEDRWTQ